METTDLTIEILRGIRDEIRETNTRVDKLTERVDNVEQSLSRRIVESEMRTATAITELARTVNDLNVMLREQFDLRPRVETCEREIAALKARLPDA